MEPQIQKALFYSGFVPGFPLNLDEFWTRSTPTHCTHACVVSCQDLRLPALVSTGCGRNIRSVEHSRRCEHLSSTVRRCSLDLRPIITQRTNSHSPEHALAVRHWANKLDFIIIVVIIIMAYQSDRCECESLVFPRLPPLSIRRRRRSPISLISASMRVGQWPNERNPVWQFCPYTVRYKRITSAIIAQRADYVIRRFIVAHGERGSWVLPGLSDNWGRRNRDDI